MSYLRMFVRCFIVLLVVAGLLWMIKLRIEVYRRNQRRIDEIEHVSTAAPFTILSKVDKLFQCSYLKFPVNTCFDIIKFVFQIRMSAEEVGSLSTNSFKVRKLILMFHFLCASQSVTETKLLKANLLCYQTTKPVIMTKNTHFRWRLVLSPMLSWSSLLLTQQ